MTKSFRECKMCGNSIPPAQYYSSEHCWICCRRTSEKDYPRYYVRSSEGCYEEVTELIGVSLFAKENQEIIKVAT